MPVISWLYVTRFCLNVFPIVTLESVNLFRNLAPDELKTLHSIAQERSVAAGEPVFNEGDPGNGIYVIRDGLVEISALIEGGQSRILARLGPGEIFGEMAVIEDRPRSASVKAIKDTSLYFIRRAEMLELLHRSSALAWNALQEVSGRLRKFDEVHVREVVQAERLAILGNFARSIIHDLKTPLTIIGISSEMAGLPNTTPEKRAEMLERIRKQIRRINDMVGDVLEFTRTQELKAQSSAVYSDFINELVPELQAETSAKSVHVQLENQPPAVKVVLDPKRLRRVFFNLVHNAVDVLPEEGKVILRFRQDGKEIVTEIEDTGPGIAREIADQLFQPFVTHGKRHGTGLGLTICKKTLEDHGGRIWSRTQPGCGAIFCFSLPVVP